MNCLNCNKEVKQSEGKRERKYCNDTCKQIHWQKTHKKEQKYVQYKTFKELLDKFNAVTENANTANLSPSKTKDNKTQGKEEKQAKNGTEKPNKANMVEVKPFSFADYLKQNK